MLAYFGRHPLHPYGWILTHVAAAYAAHPDDREKALPCTTPLGAVEAAQMNAPDGGSGGFHAQAP